MLVKNLPATQKTPVQFLDRKFPWRRDRLPTPIFLGFPGGSAGKESACNGGGPGFNPWVGKIPWRREQLSTPVFWPGEFHGLCNPRDHEESDMTDQLSLCSALLFAVKLYQWKLIFHFINLWDMHIYQYLQIRKLTHRCYLTCPRSEVLPLVDWIPPHSLGSSHSP